MIANDIDATAERALKLNADANNVDNIQFRCLILASYLCYKIDIFSQRSCLYEPLFSNVRNHVGFSAEAYCLLLLII